MEDNVFDIIADLYDITSPLKEDISFWLNMAEEYGDPILELGCGTGRILIPLAEKGYNVVGLDISKSMLNILKSKVDNLPNRVREKIEIVRGDFREFKIDREFSIVFSAYSTLYSATTQEEQLSTIRNAYKHLKEHGVLITAQFNPDIKRITENARFMTLDFSYQDPNGELIITRTSQTQYYPIEQTLKSIQVYDLKEQRKPLERYNIELNLRYIYPSEMRLMLAHCNFEIVDEFGDYNLSPLKDKSPNMIFVARKRQS